METKYAWYVRGNEDALPRYCPAFPLGRIVVPGLMVHGCPLTFAECKELHR